MYSYRKACLVALLTILTTLPATSQIFNSLIRFNCSDAGYINKVEVDALGNKFIIGNFKYSIDCDPGPGTYYVNGINNITTGYIVKLDSLNTFQWAYPLYFNTGSMAVDSKGNVYIGGSFDGTEDFDLGPGTYNMTPSGNNDAFLLKMNANGQFKYAFKLGSGGSWPHAWMGGMVIDTADAIIVAGTFNGIVDFDPGVGTQYKTVTNINDGFIAKYDSTGNFLWANQLPGTGTVSFRNLLLSPNNGILYAFGQFSQTVDFNPNLSQTNNLTTFGSTTDDIFLARYNFYGNLNWVKQFGGTNQEDATTCVIDNKANVYFTANFKGTADFDPSSNTYQLTATFGNYNDAVVCKVDKFGNFKWANHIATPLNTYSRVTHHEGMIYSTGTFELYLRLPMLNSSFNLSNNGGRDGYIYISDTAGAFISARRFGGSNDEALGVVIPDSDTSVYVTGSINGTVDMDLNQGVFNQTSTGTGSDAFMAHYTFYANGNGVDNLTACDSLQWIDGTTYYTTNKLASHFVQNAQGRDSLVNLNLTIYDSKYVVDSILSCEPITWIDGLTYSSSTNLPEATFSTTKGNCDSTVNLHFTRVYLDTSITVISPISLSSNCQNCTYQWLHCNNGYVPIPFATGATYTATINGSYAVQVSTLGGCIDTSACFDITTIGIEEDLNAIDFLISPNPTEGDLTISRVKGAGNSYEVANAMGAIIQKGTLQQDSETRVTIDGPKGIYFITVFANTTSSTEKIVKL